MGDGSGIESGEGIPWSGFVWATRSCLIAKDSTTLRDWAKQYCSAPDVLQSCQLLIDNMSVALTERSRVKGEADHFFDRHEALTVRLFDPISFGDADFDAT